MRNLAILLGCGVLSATASAEPGIVAQDLGRSIDARLTAFVEDGFSGTVLVEQGGEIILSKGYGLRDRENELPAEQDTVYDIGSLTKQFTAAGILKLEMQGKLSVNDRMEKFIPGVPADKQAITLHHLLTHTSGIGDVHSMDYDPLSRDELIEWAFTNDLKHAVGEQYEYSNTGYSLLGVIIENVSGVWYEAFLREHIFLPAGLYDTGYKLPDWEPHQIAVGIYEDRPRGTPRDFPWDHDGPYWALRANGGILSTVLDMKTWTHILESDAVLSDSARKKMFTPHVKARVGSYGYGWGIHKTDRDTTVYAHDGSNGLFFASYRYYIDDEILVIVLSNRDESYSQRMKNDLRRTVLQLDE